MKSTQIGVSDDRETAQKTENKKQKFFLFSSETRTLTNDFAARDDPALPLNQNQFGAKFLSYTQATRSKSFVYISFPKILPYSHVYSEPMKRCSRF
jgi:hypothetical protein